MQLSTFSDCKRWKFVGNSLTTEDNFFVPIESFSLLLPHGAFYVSPDRVVDRLESYSGRILLQTTSSQCAGQF